MTCQFNTDIKIDKMFNVMGISVLIFSTQFSKNRFPYAMKLIVKFSVKCDPGIKCEAEYRGRHCRVQNVDNRPRNQRENGHTEAAAI